MICQDGFIIKDPKDIIQEEKLFFQKLYGESTSIQWPYINESDIKLDENEKKIFERDFMNSELSESLFGMQNSKTPGLDGLTAEFYKFFWIHLKDLYCRVVQFVLDRGLLHDTARKGILSLLPKKDKDPDYLKNWRPLTLLNVDYKIISRAVALRLKTKIHALVNEDQTGFISGRNISYNLRTIIDIIQVAKDRSLQMVLVSMDWHKCFDKISFQAVDLALKFFNFGEKFRQVVQTLLLNSESCVLNNGYLSNFFPVLTSVKQGANASPLLFALLSEVLAIQIRKNTTIQGIVLGDTEKKLCQFADDMNLFLKYDRVTLMEIENTLDIFEGASGLQVNYDKTCIYRIGSLRNTCARLFTRKPFVWSNGPLKLLGITLDDEDKMLDLNMSELFDRMIAKCKSWMYRGLTLMGKVLIVNSLCASLFVYKMSVLRMLKAEQIDMFNQIIRRFL